MKHSLSLVVVTKNEEANIERCLASVRGLVSEIVVIDSGSTDRTCELAQKHGARVIHQEWLGYGPQKAFGATQAKYDWILSLDADEALSPELAAEISDRFKTLDPQIGYEMPRKSFHMGRWILHGGWYPDRQLRLFNRQHSNWSEAGIHEKVQCARTERLHEPILHWVFRSLSHQIETNNRYSSLQAEDLKKRGVRFSYFKLCFKPWIKFFECYFWKLGFLDGMPGFVIAVGAGYSVFLRWSKLWEIQRSRP